MRKLCQVSCWCVSTLLLFLPLSLSLSVSLSDGASLQLKNHALYIQKYVHCTILWLEIYILISAFKDTQESFLYLVWFHFPTTFYPRGMKNFLMGLNPEPLSKQVSITLRPLSK